MKNLSCRCGLAGWLLAGLLVGTGNTLKGATVTLSSVLDTTLIETSPTNNLGGKEYFNAGSTGLTPPTRNRGVFKFVLTGAVPAGSIITRAEFRLEVVRSPGTVEPVPGSVFGLHRLLVDWGEGNKSPAEYSSPGLGEPADVGEATWTHRFFPTHPWGLPGGEPEVDFNEFASTSAFVEFNDRYIFASNTETINDVQAWVDDPSQNFGYLLKTGRENSAYTARRFASSEDPFCSPKLILEFIPFQIDQVSLVGTNIEFTFMALAGQAYNVEARANAVSGSWTVVTNFPAPPADTALTFSAPIAVPQQFYRVAQP